MGSNRSGDKGPHQDVSSLVMAWSTAPVRRGSHRSYESAQLGSATVDHVQPRRGLGPGGHGLVGDQVEGAVGHVQPAAQGLPVAGALAAQVRGRGGSLVLGAVRSVRVQEARAAYQARVADAAVVVGAVLAAPGWGSTAQCRLQIGRGEAAGAGLCAPFAQHRQHGRRQRADERDDGSEAGQTGLAVGEEFTTRLTKPRACGECAQTLPFVLLVVTATQQTMSVVSTRLALPPDGGAARNRGLHQEPQGTQREEAGQPDGADIGGKQPVMAAMKVMSPQ